MSFCKCQGEAQPICSKHIYIHYSNNQTKIHNLIPAYKSINPDIKEPAIEYFQTIIKKNNDKKKIIIEETEKLVSLSNELIKNFERINRFILVNISQIIKSNRIMVSLLDQLDSNKFEFLAVANIDELDQLTIKAINDLKIMNIQKNFDSCCMKI